MDLQADKQGFAVAIRYAVVGDDNTGTALHRLPERLLGVVRRQDFQAVGLKFDLERLYAMEIVVDDEHFPR